MKSIYTLFFICSLLAAGTLVAQVPNGNFEQWNLDASIDKMVAVGWNSPGYAGCIGMPAMADQLTDAPEGNYAIGISTQYAGFAGIPTAGWLFNGDPTFDHNSNPVPLGSPLSEKPEFVSFAYTYDSDFNDQYGYVKVELFANNLVIGYAESNLYATGNRWEEINLYISYSDPSVNPDRILIQFFSNPVEEGFTGEIQPASLGIDKLSFEYLAPPPCKELLAVAYEADAKTLHVNFETCQFLGGTCLVGFCGTGVQGEESGYFFTTADPVFEVLDLQGRVRFTGKLDIINTKTLFSQVELEPGLYIARVMTIFGNPRQQLNEVKFISGK
ncbi:MAG: hypothetical protein R3B47_11040 [Bacteroidia bacterium]